MNTIDLAKNLIRIPSYVGKGCNEKEIGNYIFTYLKQFSWLETKKQYIDNDRFNIIAQDAYPTRTLLCGHLDTVQPRSAWNTDPFKPIIKNGKLYGLGATDMKGSIASLLSALSHFKLTKGLMLLFYVDEEYDFLGMKTFINTIDKGVKPHLIISADGNGLSIGNGCRGVIEIRVTITGKTGHAANPSCGVNAIQKSTDIVNKLIDVLSREYCNSELGQTTINLAFLQGGLNIGKKNNVQQFGQEGNNIADIAIFVLDIRPATPLLTADKVISFLNLFCKKEQVKLISINVRHDLGPWITRKSDLRAVTNTIRRSIPIAYSDSSSSGYIDTQILWSIFDNVSCITFGPGEIGMPHKPNEFVRIKSLIQATDVYVNLIERFGKGVRL